MDGPEKIKYIGWDELDKRKFFTIGPTLMVGVRLLIFPPILIKTRLQVQKRHSIYNGTVDAFQKIYKYEGIRGFYKGFATSNLSLITGQVYVSTLEITRTKITNTNETCKSLIAGAFASFIAQTVTVPVDIISQKQMVAGQKVDVITKSNYKSKSGWSVILEISRTSGLKGFYKGYTASILTYAPNSGIWWGSYYAFTQFFGELMPDGMPDIFIQGISGPSASIISSILTNPMDVIRTRLQVGGGKETITSAFQNLYNEEGFRGSYKGLTAKFASSIPAGFLLIVTYEMIKKLSKKTD